MASTGIGFGLAVLDGCVSFPVPFVKVSENLTNLEGTKIVD
jgi:hypothetical protein